ncbi:MAG: hypothetical protein ACYCO0_03330, partial [Candidatus Micrarchaeaceae archaeon]
DVKKITKAGLATTKGINQSNQGFYLMRNDRQIDRAQSFGLFEKHNSLNYFRGEISFPSSLDRYFGIQTNKSRYTLKDDMKDKIRDKIKGIIPQLRTETERIKAEAEGEGFGEGVKPAELIAAKANRLLKKKKLGRELLAKAEAEEKKIEQKAEAEIAQIEQSAMDPKQKQEKIEEVRRKLKMVLPFKIEYDIIGTGEFYEVRHRGRATVVVINTQHPFFTKVYERASQDDEKKTIIELLLIALAQAEAIYSDNEEILGFYRVQRREWSAVLATLLEGM